MTNTYLAIKRLANIKLIFQCIKMNEIKNENKENNIKDQEEFHTLSDYIEQNSKLISVLGVFTALTVFSHNLNIKTIGNILSFVFLSLTIIVWLELWTKFPSRPSSWRLILFENILSFSIFGIIFYWFLAYRVIWRAILVFPLWISIMSFISYLITKFNLMEKILGQKFSKYQTARIIFGLLIMIPIYFISLYLAAIISKPINYAFDLINLDIENTKIFKE